MKLTPKIATAAVAVVALGGGGVATAVASSASVRAPAQVRAAHSEPTSPDTDNVQQGDQTSPDNAAAVARAGTAHSVRSVHSVKADPSGEGTSSEGDSSDGPGGHADPSGDVQHEFNGVE